MRRVEVAVPAADDQEHGHARVTPTGSLENLSQQEADRLLDSSRGGLYGLYRRCSLAVLNSGGETDDARVIFERYADFDIRIVRQAWGGDELELGIESASDGKRMGVLMGGLSAEREVSIKSGTAVYNALKGMGYNVVPVTVGHDVCEALRREEIEIALLVLHGGWGEDGSIRGFWK